MVGGLWDVGSQWGVYLISCIEEDGDIEGLGLGEKWFGAWARSRRPMLHGIEL